MIRELPRRGGVAVQGEDEIASIGMCIGAALGGARCLTATSGPGLSLYSENLGLAVMGEVPLVIVDVQRAGPATGGATTVGQGDVQFARWGTSGGYPVIVVSPSTVPESHALTLRAFALAERFRVPVLLLTDKELALTVTAVAESEYAEAASLARLADDVPPAAPEGPADAYRPYRYDPPEAVQALVPMGGEARVRFTGSSHDERGFLTKDPRQVAALNHHLSEKIEAHKDTIALVRADLQPAARTLAVSYGVTAGAMREAVRAARAGGRRVSALTLLTLWPVPERAIRDALTGVERVVVAELNLGEYRREIERIAGGSVEVVGVHRVDGEQISPDQIASPFL
jgi:2-oxoglutarate ferredoxin oxidoreductase subunit alpha